MEQTSKDRLEELYDLAKTEKDVRTAFDIAMVLYNIESQTTGAKEPEKPTL